MICRICDKKKNWDDFANNKGMRFGKEYTCRVCKNAHTREYRMKARWSAWNPLEMINDTRFQWNMRVMTKYNSGRLNMPGGR